MAEICKQILLAKDSIEFISTLSDDDIESAITYAADKYYNTKKPVISDGLYDVLIDFLKIKKPKSAVLKNIGAKIKSKNKVNLDYWLGSMDKIKPTSNQLAIWTKKYNPPYVLSDKLDGISALLVYRTNGTINMYTRGTSTEGMDITHLIKYINVIDFETVSNYCNKNKIKGVDNLIAFRGELIIKESTFKKNWADKQKNGRNTISGLVNSKTINPNLAKDTDLVMYEIVDPFYPVEKQFKIINKIGFDIVTHKIINQELTYESLSKYFKERRDKSIYQIDGIIVASSEQQDRNIKGNPEYAFAFKDVLEDQISKTTVLDIEWNISKDGYIKPTLILKPVTIGGVEIKRATGFNAKFIVENILGPGAEIELIRSGDVIPYVKKVLKVAKSGKPYLPDSNWQWNETKVDIKIDDMESNEDVLVKNIYYFFSKLETKGLGEKNVEKMIEAGLNTIPKILDADEQRFLMVDGFKEKTANNLVESIKKAVTNIPLSKLMASSNKLGHGIGEEKLKQILIIYPNILNEYKSWSKTDFIDKIKNINNWEEKTATVFVTNFNDFIKFYNSIKKYISIEIIKNKEIVKGEFTNKIIVLTGFRDKQLQDKIVEQGGKIGSSISKNTDYVVVSDQELIDKPTTKVNKAVELNIKIITKDKLIKMLN